MDEPLPDLLARVAEVAGEDAALLLAKAFGGRPLYLPLAEEIEPGHRLSELIGMERARAVCTAIGQGEVIFPRGPFSSRAELKRRVAEMLDAKKSHATIALALNLHIRSVEKIAARLRKADDRQGRLL